MRSEPGRHQGLLARMSSRTCGSRSPAPPSPSRSERQRAQVAELLVARAGSMRPPSIMPAEVKLLMDLVAIQKALTEQRLDGWLLYDFRGSNPIARAGIGFDEKQIGTPRWFYLIPRAGQPAAIRPVTEPRAWQRAPRT